MMFLSVAEDKEGHIHVYLNTDDKLYCTDALLATQVQTYVELLALAFVSFTDPLKLTTLTIAEKATTYPATMRKAIGINEAFSEVWVVQYDAAGRSRNAELVEEGMRSVINSTFLLAISKLFFIDLQSTLDQQKSSVIESKEPAHLKGSNKHA